jgi:hypothetical protein
MPKSKIIDLKKEDQPHSDQDPNDEALDLADQSRSGWMSEYAQYIMQNKKWWLIPIVAGLLILAGLIMLSSSSVAPMIYALF